MSLALRQLPHRGLQPVLAAHALEPEDHVRGGEEARGAARLHGRRAHGYGHVGLAPARGPVEHEPLRRVQERQRHEVLRRVALGHGNPGEVVVGEGLRLREAGAPVEPLALVPLAHLRLALQQRCHRPGLGRGGLRQERLYRLVGEVHGPRQLPQPLRLAPAPHRHHLAPIPTASS